MTRKSILMSALTACIASAAMLTTPAATAGFPGGGHYDCSKNKKFIYTSRHLNARMMQIFNFFDRHATGLVEEAIRELDDNMGGDEGNLHTIHNRAQSYLSYITHEAEVHLSVFCAQYILDDGLLSKCPRIFGRNISFCNSMKRRIAARNVELRDQLAAALQNALNYD